MVLSNKYRGHTTCLVGGGDLLVRLRRHLLVYRIAHYRDPAIRLSHIVEEIKLEVMKIVLGVAVVKNQRGRHRSVLLGTDEVQPVFRLTR